MNSPLKKLDQSVFDGLPPEYKFAAVDAYGLAWAYEKRTGVISFDGMRRLISVNFDATDWKNSLIERKEIATANSHGIECIDVIDAATENLRGIEAMCTANAIKYLWRWKRKNGLQDLQKAKLYIDHLIDCLSDNAGDNNE